VRYNSLFLAQEILIPVVNHGLGLEAFFVLMFGKLV
jgi:hypothetical protein